MSQSGEGSPSTNTQDFATTATGTPAAPAASPSPRANPRAHAHVHYDLRVDTARDSLSPADASGQMPGVSRSDTEMTRGISPIRRRLARAATFRTVEDFDDFELRPGWQPGSEPGVDTSKADGGHASMPTLHAPSQITVVDFSQDMMIMNQLDNSSIHTFLKTSQPRWAKCRWINVNGLSWDVIQALGQYKRLHQLAIEDLMNTRNRTKADWYATHAFIVLTLQKLVHLDDPPPYSSIDAGDDTRSWKSGSSGRSKRNSLYNRLKNMFGRSKRLRSRPGTKMEDGEPGLPTGDNYLRSQPTGFSDVPDLNSLRTLQRYHSSPNDARTDFMEKHSVLSGRRLAVAAEQVSLFITNDNVVISFFELSAQDVEKPILSRLHSDTTILRKACDASMIAQAILDAIIDLAIPVTACYSDVVGDLELDVLTRPNISHTKKLYIAITEINKMLSFITPITNLISVIRDHRIPGTQEAAAEQLQNPGGAVGITPMTYIYLGDVLDHCVLISESLQQIKGQADGMISLIFNTISAYQNESMKQLTIATIIFLPLTFITGYFGQNFAPFPDLDKGYILFWQIAIPVVFATVVILMRDIIAEALHSLKQKHVVVNMRKSRDKKRKAA